MNIGVQRVRQQGVLKLLEQAGTRFDWYRSTTSATGNPAYGQGQSYAYSTGALTGIWQAMGAGNVAQQAGGQTVEGAETLYSRSCPGTADKLSYGGASYIIVAVPWPCQIGETLYWRIQLKRG